MTEETGKEAVLVYVEALSAREMEVLVSLSREGQSNTAIGEELFISEKTVRSHLISIMDKFGVHTRTQVVLTAQRLGLVTEPFTMSPTATAMLAFIKAYPHEYAEVLKSGFLDKE